ncbi:MAG: roadblock/LC7 domain-containing protein [Gemmatimonadetes bacterium]|nr:roadblock/LC7 domain-containing protein [Gemmatimonadota bacterium]
MKSSPFSELLGALVRQRGVTGALVVSEADGLVVDSQVSVGMRGEVVAALSASLYRRARLAAQAAGYGETTVLQLEAQQGRICAVGKNDLVLVAVTELGSNIGLVRMEMLKGLQGGALG